MSRLGEVTGIDVAIDASARLIRRHFPSTRAKKIFLAPKGRNHKR